MQRITRTLPRFQRRTLTTTRSLATSWSKGPSPPRLPKEEQEIFEQLQRQSTGAFSTPRSPPKINQSPQSTATDLSAQAEKGNVSSEPVFTAKVKEDEALHPNVRRGAPPEFEGDVNPKTGESGGPKNDPLRWAGDWSYNGRATDF